METGARLDVRAQGFWGIHYQQAYFDINFVFLIPWLPLIVTLLFQHVFDLMIVRNTGFMSNMCVIMSEASSPPCIHFLHWVV